MKKILYTATVASHICQFHLPYFKMLQEMGYEVHVAAHDNLAEKNGLALKYVDKFFEVPFRRSPFSPKNLKAKKQLKRIIDSEGYDIIVCNTPVGGIMTRLAAKGARRRGTRVIYIAHGFHFYKGASKKNWLIYYPIEKHFAKKCDTVVTINEEDYLFAKSKFKCEVRRIHGAGVSTERYPIVSDEQKREAKLAAGYSPDDFICLCIGEINENKNQKMVISAMAEVVKAHPNTYLLLAGNGPLEAELKERISFLGLEKNVKMLGYVTNLEDYQRISDLGISCSIREGLGLNLIESMLSGNAVVATKNRGHSELVRDGENGYLVENGDSAALASRICECISDRNSLNRMSEQGYGFSKAYTVDAVKKEIESILFDKQGIE